MRHVLPILVGLVLIVSLVGCGERSYPRETPEAFLDSAASMAERGDVRRLPDLVWADDEPTRRVFDRLGSVLGRADRVAALLRERFPEDAARVQRDLERAAEEGVPSPIARALTGARTRRGADGDARRDAFDAAIRGLLADPYAAIRDGRERLSTAFVDDNTVMLQWDGRPLLPPFGVLIQRQDDGLWYLTLPLNAVPRLARYLPSANADMELIWLAAMQMLENMLRDVEERVESGRYRSLDEAARGAGEMLFLPGAVLFAAIAEAGDDDDNDNDGGD